MHTGERSKNTVVAGARSTNRPYRELGFHLVEIPGGPLPERTAVIERTVARR